MSNTLKSMLSVKIGVFALAITGAIILSANNANMLTGHPIEFDLDTDNYVGTHNFQVDIPDITVINTEFVFVGGVNSKTVVVKGKKKASVTTEFAPVEVQRIYKGVDDLYGWRLEVENGNIERRDITITMLNAAFVPVRVMVLEGAWPSSWKMPNMDASASGPAYETFFFTADRVTETAP